MDDILALLEKAEYPKLRSDEAAKAVDLMIATKIFPAKRGDYQVTILVYFPPHLEKYFDGLTVPLPRDMLASMISRCIEHPEVTDITHSLKLLLHHKLHRPTTGDDALMPLYLRDGRYKLDLNLYALAKAANCRDLHLEAKLSDQPLIYTDGFTSTNYFGYRRAWHLLLYGSKEQKLQFIGYWEIHGYDCTFSAYMDFYHVDAEKGQSDMKTILSS